MKAEAIIRVIKALAEAKHDTPEATKTALVATKEGQEFLKLTLGDLLAVSVGDLLDVAITLNKE